MVGSSKCIYGRIPHILIEESLKLYHMLEHFRGIIRSHFVVYNKQVYNDMGKTTEGHRDRMYHLSYSIRYWNGHDHNGEREREREQQDGNRLPLSNDRQLTT